MFTKKDLGDVTVLTEAMANIESVSGHEDRLATKIYDTLSSFGHLDTFRTGNRVVAINPKPGAKRVIIAGHIDTVPVNGNLPVQRRYVDRVEKLWGRGVVDMKGGAAIMLSLAALRPRSAYELVWIWYDSEELGAAKNGLGLLYKEHPGLFRADLAILAEPSCSQVEAGCNGTMRARLSFDGRRSHTARWWRGVNAIHATGELLNFLAGFQPRQVEIDGLVYREGLSAVSISGGVANNVIPDRCEVVINFRFAPDRSPDQAKTYLRDLLSGYVLEIEDWAPGALPDLSQELPAYFVAKSGLEVHPKLGWTDVSRFSALGVPALNFGPGDPLLAHADDEAVEVGQIVECRQVLDSFLGA